MLSSRPGAWEPFSGVARNLILSAKQVALESESQAISTQHFLFAILNDSESVGLLALEQMGVDIVKLRESIEDACHNNSEALEPGSVFSPTSKRTIELAFEAASKLGHDYIGTGHLLVGLVECPESQASLVLENFKVNRSQLLEEVAKLGTLEKPHRFNLRKTLSSGFQKLWGQMKRF